MQIGGLVKGRLFKSSHLALNLQLQWLRDWSLFIAWGQRFTGNELFMIIEIDVASNAVSPVLNTIFFLKRLSLQVLMYCYMCTNFNAPNRWLLG